jgi:Big-like domain-containing protein/leishmanolysin
MSFPIRWACLTAPLLLLNACGSEPPVPTTITLTPTTLTFSALGQTQQLTPAVSDERGDPLQEAAVSWASSNAAIATVSSTGLVTARGAGSAQVTATAGAANATAQVTVAQTPAAMLKISGDSQVGFAGEKLPSPLIVEVRDAAGNTVPGVSVVFENVQGGGRPDPIGVRTSGDGRASSELWSGPVAGTPQGISARIAATAISVSFTATTTAGPPATISMAAGNNQHVRAGEPVLVRPTVVLRDRFDNPVAGIPVEFEIVSGGGSLTGSSAVTDGSGRAEVGGWRLGPSNPNQLRATAAGAGINWNPVTFTASTAATPYNIEVRFLSAVSPAQAESFARAEQKWESVIVGDVSDEIMNEGPATCRDDTPAIRERVDDVLIFVTLEPIDGPGRIFGAAGPCWIRDVGFLPLIGVMVFDSQDLDLLERDGLLDAGFMHEMGHVLGFGPTWRHLGLLADAVESGGSDPHFTGHRAIAAFNTAGGSGYAGAKVPVENAFGPGTNDAHWRESVFGHELMTGFVDDGENPLSAITVASLADIGYAIDLSGADPYTLSSALRIPGRGRTLMLENDILRLPIRTVGPSGRRTGTIRP